MLLAKRFEISDSAAKDAVRRYWISMHRSSDQVSGFVLCCGAGFLWLLLPCAEREIDM